MTSWHSYPSIYNLGHRAVAEVLSVPVDVEEKVDGSQFSFGKDHDGNLHFRSKGSVINETAPEKMFAKAVYEVLEIKHYLTPGWTYRGEYLQKPKHNTLAYSRTPKRHVIIFDINPAEEAYLTYEEKKLESERLGLETVPLLFSGQIKSSEQLLHLLNTESILGGVKIEGVVLKPVGRTLFGPDKKALLAKFVSEDFKESHQKEWKKSNPTSLDILTAIGEEYRTEARWRKAVQHLAEQGLLTESPKDIGLLLKEIVEDVRSDSLEEISKRLMSWAWPSIQRKIVAGFPEWYKKELMEKQVDGRE